MQDSDIIQLGDIEMLYACEDKSNSADKTSTITGINFSTNPSSSSSIKKLDAISPYAERKTENKKGQYLMIGIIGALALVVIILLGFLFAKFGGN